MKVFSFLNFRLCPIAKIENSYLKNSGKKLGDIQDFRIFRRDI